MYQKKSFCFIFLLSNILKWINMCSPMTYFVFLCCNFEIHLLMGMAGLPSWLSCKESTCQCRKYRLDPWVKNIPWRRKWLSTPVFLPGKSHGQRSLVVKGVKTSWTRLSV